MRKFENKALLCLAVSVLLGTAVGAVFIVFEWIVKTGTDFIWNDLFQTDENRWRVVPLAIGLSLAFGLVLKATGHKRIVPVGLDPLQEKHPAKVSFAGILNIFLVGATSLLAGASLGPEASLVALCSGMGIWMAAKAGVKSLSEILLLSGVGALLVVFFGSVIPIIIPLLILYKKYRSLTPVQFMAPWLAGLAAYGLVYLLKGSPDGWGAVQVNSDFELFDFSLAAVLGFIVALAAMLLKKFISVFAIAAKAIENRTHWLISAGIFGAVLGVLYLIGGESVQFSGSDGTSILVNNHAAYGVAAFAGLAFVKLLVTAWSLAAGYRGGLVFPSVYAGVAISLLVISVVGSTDNSGILVGSIAGTFSAMTTPALGFIMLAALLPVKMIGLAAAGILGATAGQKALKRVSAIKSIGFAKQ